MQKPQPALSFWQIWNMCFGFLGIQFGFALQNATPDRVFWGWFWGFMIFGAAILIGIPVLGWLGIIS